MAIYPFIKIETIGTDREEIVEVFIPITDDVNTYNGEGGEEIGKWKRYWGGRPSIHLSFDTKIDPNSSSSFVKATNKKMTMGEMFDLSKEMSERRVEKNGVDEVKEKMYQEYKKKNGVKHQNQITEEKRAKVKKKMDELGIQIEA